MVCPAITIAAIASGAGKTTLALAIARALTLRGLRVQTFKVGPDFLDPTHLALATGRPCYNLDSWMCGKDYVRERYASKTIDADVAIIEGVMGLYDGASPDSIEGSTAEIAKLLDAPILLTVNVRGMARSLAALVQGACSFEPGLPFRGVLANHCGSDRHADILRQALQSANLPPLLGSIPTGAFPELASRHLGLVAATPESLQTLDAYAAIAEQHLHAVLDGVKAGGERAEGRGKERGERVERGTWEGWRREDRGARATLAPERILHRAIEDQNILDPRPSSLSLAIAHDAAFSFYYPDTLEALAATGLQLVPFSPISDTALPENIQGIYFGGGYPELHAPVLSANTAMLAAIRDFAQRGGFIYAECGGMMYLSESIETLEGVTFPMTGLLPFGTRMTPKRKVLGYVEVTLQQDTLWGQKGDTCRGHEFHYSDIIPVHHLGTPGSSLAQEQTTGKPAESPQPTPPSPTPARLEASPWKLDIPCSSLDIEFPPSLAPRPSPLPPSYLCSYRGNRAPRPGGFRCGNVLADYIHLHWASHPTAIHTFTQTIGAKS